MWNVLRHQIRAYVDAKRRQRGSATAKPVLHMKRTGAEIMIDHGPMEKGQVVKARVILNDLTPGGVYAFATDQVAVGSSVALTMEEPKRFYVRGTVLTCQTVMLDQRVITQQAFPYRVGIEFKFQNEKERQAVQRYYEEIRSLFMVEEPRSPGEAGDKAA